MAEKRDNLTPTDLEALKEFEAELDRDYDEAFEKLAKAFEKKGPPDAE